MANRCLIAYDLHEKTDKAYKAVAAAIKSCGDAIEIQESVWIVYSEMLRKEISSTVESAMTESDKLIVTFIKGVYHSGHGDKDLTEYLEEHPYAKD